MLLDGETFDLVQHIDTVLAAVAGHELEPRINAGADAVGARDRDAGLPHRRGRRRGSCASCARTSCEVARDQGPARRLGRNAPVQPLRAPADHRPRPLPEPRRPDAVRRPARADLRHARPRRRRRPGEGDRGRERAAARISRRCSALSASSPFWRGEPTGLARAGRWSSPPSRARGRRRASATTPSTRRSSASSRRPAASPTTRTSGGTSACTPSGARSRSGSATRSRASRTPSRSPPTARRSSSSSPSATRRVRRSRSYHRILTTENKWLAARYGLEAPMMDLATGRRNRVAARAARPADAARDRAARARARLGTRARGDRGDPPPRQRRRPAAADLQREPRHRRGRPGDRGRNRGRRGSGVVRASNRVLLARDGPWLRDPRLS